MALTSLERLALTETGATDALVDALESGRLPELARLQIHGNRLSEGAQKALAQALEGSRSRSIAHAPRDCGFDSCYEDHPMQIQIRWSEVESSDALTAHVEKEVHHALRHCEDDFTRVDVHIHDDNAEKSGSNDKRCKIEARPRGADPLIVEGTGDDVYKTITSTSKKLERAARTFVDKRRKR